VAASWRGMERAWWRPGCSARSRAARSGSTRTTFGSARERGTGQGVNRHCELRTPVARPLPDPLNTDEHGDLLSVQLFEPESAQSGGLRSVDFEVRDGFRVWTIDDVLHAEDVEGRTSYGVQVDWPQSGQPTRHDPL